MANSIVTVADLASVKGLEIRVIAGDSGIDREITWAHSCEQPDPESWLNAGELLMTIGIGIPERSADQVRYIRSIFEAGIAALMAGIDERLPTLSDAMLHEASHLGLPILLVPKHIPFVAVSRHIASLTQDSQTAQVLLLAKLYGLTAARNYDQLTLAERLAELLQIDITVSDQRTGMQLLGAALPIAAESARSRSVPLPTTRRPTTLTTVEPEQQTLSSMVLVHLQNILEVEVDRLLGRAQDLAERSRRALAIITTTGDTSQARELLDDADVSRGLRTIAFAEDAADELALAGFVSGTPMVVGTHRGRGIAMVPEQHLSTVKAILHSLGLTAGASSVFDGFTDHKGSFAQAENSLETALRDHMEWVEYEGVEIFVLTRSHSEARRIVTDVLGPLTGEDNRATGLRETLFTYLKHNRKWNETAEALGIHRQTLAYRLRQIESSLGRSLSDTGDLAALWIAMKAWDDRSPN